MYKNFFLRFWHKPLLLKVKTFFDYTIIVPLPLSTDIFHLGAKNHPSELSLTKYILENVKGGDVVLDVGTHIGFYSLLLSKQVGHSGKVHSFEPTKNIYEIANRNLSQWNNVVLNNKAISDRDGSTLFYEFPLLYSEFNTTNIEQYQNEDWIKKNPAIINHIEIVSLDSYCSEHKVKPTFIKIDVEGGEHMVVGGMSQILSDFKPVVALEFIHPKLGNKTHHDAAQKLLKFHYAAYICDLDGRLTAVTDIDKYLIKNDLIGENIIYIHKDKLSSLISE